MNGKRRIHYKGYREICLYFFWGILMVGKGLGLSSAMPIYVNMTWGAMTFALLVLLLRKWNRRDIIIAILAFLLGILVWYFSKSPDFLLTVITLVCIQNNDLMKFLRFTLFVRGIFFVFRTSFAIFGILDIQKMFFYNNGLIRVRYALGYSHPNAAQYELFVIISLLFICYAVKMKIYHYILLLLYNYFIYHYTNSRSGFIIITFEILFIYLLRSRSGTFLRFLLKIFGKYCYVIGAISSFLICYLVTFDDHLLSFGTLSSRFQSSSAIMENYSIPLFGQPNIITDFGYIEILYSKGIVVYILFLLGNILMAKKLIKEKRYTILFVQICYGVYTLFESYSISVLMNVSLLFISELFNDYRKKLNSSYVKYILERE